MIRPEQYRIFIVKLTDKKINITNRVHIGIKNSLSVHFIGQAPFLTIGPCLYQNNPKCDPSNIGAVHKSKQIYSYLAFLRPTWSKLTLETVSIQSSRACSCNNFRCWPPVCTCPYHQISKQSNFGPY